MQDLGWDQADLVRASGVSATTVRWLQTAAQESYRRSTLTKVCKALGWTSNAIDLVLAGGPFPEPKEDPVLTYPSDDEYEAAEDRKRRGSGLPAGSSGLTIPESFTDEELADVQRYIDFLASRRGAR